MPPLNRLRPRGGASGRNFSIIFAIIAFAVVSLCLFWGFLLPKYRKKYPRPPSSTVFNRTGASQISLRSVGHSLQRFPSHPVVLRGFRKQSSGQLRQYNPRIETPFPSSPPLGDSISLPSITPRNAPRPTIVNRFNSNGLFSPARDRVPTRRGCSTAGLSTAEPETSSSKTTPHDNKAPGPSEYVLAIPEPLTLRAKSAGRPPPLTRQLEKFPLPRSSSSNGRLPHPRKLFEDLERREDSKATNISLGTPSPLPGSFDRACGLTKGHDNLEVKDMTIGVPENDSQAMAEEDEITTRSNKQNTTFMDTISGTWSSTNADSEELPQMARAGTLTRPKTPVTEMRHFYDRNADFGVMTAQASSKQFAKSSPEQLTASTLSSHLRSTPPTSPMFSVKDFPQPSMLSQARLPGARNDINTPTPDGSGGRLTASSMALPSPDKLGPLRKALKVRKVQRRSIGILQNGKTSRPRPARLNIGAAQRSVSTRKQVQRHSMSSLGSILMPLIRSKRPSFQASSVYSRDTRGVSFISPASPTFSGKADDQLSKNEPLSASIHRKASSMDLLRSKIDQWDLHTADFGFSTSPSLELKRALSDFGPRSPTWTHDGFLARAMADVQDPAPDGLGLTLPKICIAEPSDVIFRDFSRDFESGRVLKQVLDMEMAVSESNLSSVLGRGSAPGGAEWI